MRYSSTRGGVKGQTFEQALFSGYCSDGGLLFPDSVPQIPQKTLQTWADLSYVDLCKEIIPLFVDDTEIPRKDLHDLIDRAFSKFRHPDVVNVARLKKGLNVLELWHGATLAFKDLALSCVGQFLEYFLEKRKKHVTIVVGTSGDTGSAAIEAVRGLKWVDIVVLLPHGRCSSIQELQMTTVLDDNVHVFAVDGTSDDLDYPIKQCFVDAEFVQKHNLISINSINWARVMVQTVHHFYAYFQMCRSCDQEVEIVVPTGAMGNITAGCIARMMGLPVRFVSTVNVNDIVDRALKQGDFSMADKVIPTSSNSMDIQVPYNFERILYLFSGQDSALVARLLREFEATGKTAIPKNLLDKLNAVMRSYSVTEADTLLAMRTCWEENQYLLCPHTAVAASYHMAQESSSSCMRVCVATAAAAKFPEAVEKAGLLPQPTPELEALVSMPTKYQDMKQGQDWEAMLRAKIQSVHLK
ncbi:threonine synthase-like 2 isoform X1 [Branchiostoma floridae]|uniref:Threonine synthase-like 2 n=1 Tax=Branchiostoma floridae TaxID=7739 RepID=A0A9J7L0L0_BRAFL|nr:threonine synthase-like 2 isoform X1 [Branchiostoma floridae]XP_035673867.1 threonine synthase-like 2 isoform X1 [Branchiostoma floridae]